MSLNPNDKPQNHDMPQSGGDSAGEGGGAATLILDAAAPDDLDRAAVLIRAGALVVFPTETVYGLGASAFDPAAASRIFAAKGRPADNPLIVHISGIQDLPLVARDLSPLARFLFERFSPGPITVIVPKSDRIAASVSAGLDTVGVRIPAMAEARRFLERCAVPVAAPSANRSGLPSPTNFAMARDAMTGRVAAILRGPESTLGLESTIVYPRAGDGLSWRVHVLRPGAVSPDDIRAALAEAGFRAEVLSGPGDGNVRAPGTRYRHYSPRAAVRLFSNPGELRSIVEKIAAGTVVTETAVTRAASPANLAEPGETTIGDIPTGNPPHRESAAGRKKLLILTTAEFAEAAGLPESPGLSGLALRGSERLKVFPDLETYAHDLYSSLFEADRDGIELIAAWLPPRAGLGIALADRLTRAAGLE